VRGISGAVGGERTPWRHIDRLPQCPHSEFCEGQQHFKIWEDLSNSKNMVFNVRKLVNSGVDLTLWRRVKKNQHRWNEQQILRI
jgi:hypothetical protein